jgi:hypothetical protein
MGPESALLLAISDSLRTLHPHLDELHQAVLDHHNKGAETTERKTKSQQSKE